MLQFLSIHWQLNIVLGAMFIALGCSLLSTYVVLRRMAMLSEGVAHSSIGGIGVALVAAYFIPVLDHPYLIQLMTAVFCVATALIIGYTARSKRVSEDSAIGIFLVATVALGTLLVLYRKNLELLAARARELTHAGGAAPTTSSVPISLESVLFGHVVSMTPFDTINAALVALACFALVAVLYYQLLYTTLDEEMARVNGVKTRLINALLQCMVAVTIVAGVRIVGAFMILALMVIPGATANLLSRRFDRVMLISLLVGTLGALGGITLSLATPLGEYPPGPILVLVLFVIFAMVWLFRHLVKPRVPSAAATLAETIAPAPPAANVSHSLPGR